MQIKVHNSYPYKDVTIKEDSTTIELGLLNKAECRKLAAVFKEAIGDLIPDNEERAKFLSEDE